MSLQKFHGSEQLGEVEGRFTVTDLGSRLDDMMDTAAVMKNLDLVIVVELGIGPPGWCPRSTGLGRAAVRTRLAMDERPRR